MNLFSQVVRPSRSRAFFPVPVDKKADLGIILDLMTRYNTEQKRMILGLFEQDPDRSLTGEEISEALPDVGKSTVYRVLGEMTEENVLSSYENGRKRCFFLRREDCRSHLHVFCPSCGRLMHLSADAAKEIKRIISGELGYVPEHFEFTLFVQCREHGEEK